MANYTQLSAKEVDGLAGFFGIGEVTSFSSLEGGSNNSNYLLKARDDVYILSVGDGKKQEEVEVLSRLLGLLEKYDFPTTKLVVSANRTKVTAHRGKAVFLKKFIEGKVCDDLTIDMLVQLGESIADLHQIPVPDYLPTSFPYGVDFFSEVISTGRDPKFSGWLERKKLEITSAFHSDLPRGLVHGDIFYDNVLFNGNRLAAIIDFEEASDYYLIFDLGMCAVGTCTDKGRILLPKVKALVSGYQNRRKLSDLEKASLQIFAVYGAVATSFWRFRQYHLLCPDKERTNRFKAMVDLADDIAGIPSLKFRYEIF